MRNILRKAGLLLFFSVLFAITASAQMTDDQITEYVKTRMEAGDSQTKIGKDLISRGVTRQQLERLKTQYEQKKGSSKSSTSATATGSTGLRVNNGETTPDRRRVKSNQSLDGLSDYAEQGDEDIEQEEEKPIFGHDIFRSTNLTFEPAMNLATPSDYMLGPGDEVVLDIYGASQMNGTYTISPDGNITIPDEGLIHVGGMSVAQAQQKVKRAIGGHYSGSEIKLTIGQTRTITVNVLGEVKTPGTYSLSAFSTVFNALYLAGGIREIGTLRNIKVSRNGRIISVVDVYDYIMNGNMGGNVALRDNDVILVGPYENLIEVTGKVKRPMYYEMKKNESLQSLLQFAGGFTGDAYKKNVRVERVGEDGITVHNVNEWDFGSFTGQDGDIVYVASSLDRLRNTVTVSGAVFRPGQYKLGSQVTSVRSLVEQAGGLMEQAITARAVIHRMKENRTLQTISINLAAIMNGTIPDVSLQSEDELIISSTKDIDDLRKLYIYGDVLNPGEFDYSENETVEDLVMVAGGLLESASLVNIEVARRITSSEDNPDGNKMAKIYNLTLDKNFMPETTANFALEPFDIVTIHRNPNYQVQKRVYVAGEVQYGGAYILANKEERITDILNRAGGLTTKAYPGGVKLIRRVSKKEKELQLLKLEVATTAEDSVEIMNNLNKKTYTVGIDLEKAIAKPGSSYDIVLQENDSVYIPQLNNTVKISGEVLFPNTVAYTMGKKASYYINQAGGVRKTGKKSKAYVLYPNGQVSIASKGEILPGCEVVVPTKPERTFDAQRSSLYISATSAVATIAAVIISAMK
jgi:protein involved in polysaccharide export with SLBB domain